MLENIEAKFEAEDHETYVYPASNPQYLEIRTRANIVQFETVSKALNLQITGGGFLVSDHKDWIIAWIKWTS